MIIQNAVRVQKKIYISKHVHDFVEIKFRTVSAGKDDELHTVKDHKYFIDGGNHYQRSSIMPELFDRGIVENYYLDFNSSVEDVLNKLCWGNYGKNQEYPECIYTPIREFSLDHLYSIMENVKFNEKSLYYVVILYWSCVYRLISERPHALTPTAQDLLYGSLISSKNEISKILQDMKDEHNERMATMEERISDAEFVVA